MSMVVATKPRSGRYAPYKHPNVGFLSSSELLLGSTHSLPLLHSGDASNTSRNSVESAWTVHAVHANLSPDNGRPAFPLPTIRLNLASDSISDLDISNRNLALESESKASATESVRRVARFPVVPKTVVPANMRSEFDWNNETPTSDPDSIRPFERQSRAQKAPLLRPSTETATFNYCQRPWAKSRQQRLWDFEMRCAGVEPRPGDWEQQMRDASACAGHACWSSAYAANGKINEAHRNPSHKHDRAKQGGPHLLQKLSSKLGIDKLRNVRSKSDPLPVGNFKTVSDESSMSVPADLSEQKGSSSRRRKFLPQLGRKRQSQ